MGQAEENLLRDLGFRIQQLKSYCDSLKQTNELLLKEIAAKEEESASLSEQIENLKTEISNLRFAKALAHSSDEDSAEAKKRLSKLVREVDKCISLLKA